MATTAIKSPGVTIVLLEDESLTVNSHTRPRSGLEIERLLSIRSWTLSTLRYFFFLLIFTIVVFTSRDGETAFYFTDQLREHFLNDDFPAEYSHVPKTFWDVSKHGEVFQWLRGPFLTNLHMTSLYSGAPVPPPQLRRVIGYDKVVGRVRLRQLRVRAQSCMVRSRMRAQIDECYAAYSSSAADRAPYGPNGEWTWGRDSQVVFAGYNGRLQLYPDSGYFVDLPVDANGTTAALARLEQYEWIDLYTRMVAVEFTVFNANLELFCVIRIAFEFPQGGGVLPNASFRTVNLLRYMGGNSYEVAFEALLAVLVLLYIAEEVVEIVRACRGRNAQGVAVDGRGWRLYFVDDVWNYLDLLNYTLFIVVAILRIISVVMLSSKFKTAAFSADDSYINFQGVALLQSQELNINAFNMLLCWIKTLKFLSRIDRINHLSQTLSRSTADIAMFVIIFFIFFFAYAQAGWMMFAVDVQGFRTVARSAESLMLSIFGAFDYKSLEQTNRYLAPLFFFSYMLMTSFILLNVFIAIITNAYDLVRENAARRDAEARVSALLAGKVVHTTVWAQIKRAGMVLRDAMLVHRIRRRQQLVDQLQAEKLTGDVNDDGKLSLDEARAIMNGNDEAEMDEFDRIDTNEDQRIDVDELRATIDGLTEEKALLEDALSDFIVLEKALASDSKKMSPEQNEQREELSKQLEDYKRRIKHLGQLAPHELRELHIRTPTDGVDMGLLAHTQSAAGDGHAELVGVLAALQLSVAQGFAGLNTRLRAVTTRIKRLEDDAREARHKATRAAAGMGHHREEGPVIAAGVGKPGRPVFDMSQPRQRGNSVAPSS